MKLPNLSPNDWGSLGYIIRLIDERLSEIEGIHGRIDFRQPGTQQDQGLDSTETVRYDQLEAVTGFVQTSRTLTAGSGLAGGGDLSADRTFSVNVGDGIEIVADAVTADLGDGLTFAVGEIAVDNGTGLDFTGAGALKIADTAVVAGAYNSANITVDQQGRITAAANGLVLGDVDRLTSQVGAGSTLILTDDNTDMLLTTSLGKLEFSSAQADGAGNIAYEFDTANNLTTSTVEHTRWTSNNNLWAYLWRGDVPGIGAGSDGVCLEVRDVVGNQTGVQIIASDLLGIAQVGAIQFGTGMDLAGMTLSDDYSFGGGYEQAKVALALSPLGGSVYAKLLGDDSSVGKAYCQADGTNYYTFLWAEQSGGDESEFYNYGADQNINEISDTRWSFRHSASHVAVVGKTGRARFEDEVLQGDRILLRYSFMMGGN